MSNYVYFTEEGLQKLRDELTDLKTRGRQDAAKAIAEARAQGDLSENAEYDAAKEAQGHLERRISELEATLGNARIIDESQLDTSKVTVLSNVEIKNLKVNKVFQYKLVSEKEANVKEKKISVNSPIGKALLGKKVGEVAKVQTPNGEMELEVISISL